MGLRYTRRAALSTVAVALVAAGPAAAESKTPVAPANKGCEVQLKGPGAGYTCDDGTWKETVTLTAGTWTTSVAVPVTTSEVLTLAP